MFKFKDVQFLCDEKNNKYMIYGELENGNGFSVQIFRNNLYDIDSIIFYDGYNSRIIDESSTASYMMTSLWLSSPIAHTLEPDLHHGGNNSNAVKDFFSDLMEFAWDSHHPEYWEMMDRLPHWIYSDHCLDEDFYTDVDFRTFRNLWKKFKEDFERFDVEPHDEARWEKFMATEISFTLGNKKFKFAMSPMAFEMMENAMEDADCWLQDIEG